MRRVGKISELFLYLISIKEERSSIIGDYTEIYNEILNEKNLISAKKWLWLQILISFPIFIKYNIYWGSTMLVNFIKIFFRNIKRDKLSFLINLFGLSASLTGIFFISFYLNDELNVDKFHENNNQLYSILRNRIRPNGVIETSKETPSPLAEAFKKEFPEVKNSVSVNYMTISSDGNYGILLKKKDKIKVKGQFCGKEFFNIFSFPIIKGDKSFVLNDKHNVVITEKLANKLFNTTENVLGKSINYKHQTFEKTFQISGICKTPPANSTIQFDIIFNFDILLDLIPKANSWTGSYACTYLVLKENTNIEQFNKKIKNYIELKHSRNKNRTLFVQKFSDNFLYGNFENGVQAGGKIFYIKLFFIVAIFIMIIASANFINLTTAKASLRLKEIGIKKTLGVKRKTLIIQFLSESMMMIFISSIVAILSTILLSTKFNELVGKNIFIEFGINHLSIIVGIMLLVGIISSFYPALYLSKFNPTEILKQNILNGAKENIIIRKGLVISQFLISTVFIIMFFVINSQLNFIQTKNLGYNSENIIIFKRSGPPSTYKAFMLELKKIAGIKNVSSMNTNMIKVRNSSRLDSWEGKAADSKTDIIPYPSINYDFLETLGIKILKGRSFSRKFKNENTKLILNESAIKMMGLKDPIGKTINIDREDKQIIGIVKDFNFESLYKDINPLAIKFNEYGKYIYVKLKAGSEKETINQIKILYETLQQFKFEYSFLNETHQKVYRSETKLADLVKYSSILVIIISFLGLFGLVTFSNQRREKEVCIRKVLGSSLFSLINTLSIDFLKILIVSLLIALPISCFLINRWLNQFANRVDIGIWFFVGIGFSILILGWITVIFQILIFGIRNPINGLRND